MRWTLSLVPLLMLSGCLAAGTDAAGGEAALPEGDGVGLRHGVVFFEADYAILPNDVTELDVAVPKGAVNVVVEVSTMGLSNPADEADVTLSGCGGQHLSWSPGSNIVISVSGGGNWRQADLCGAADAGAHTLTLDGGLTAMSGRVLLRADLP